eukprot:scaffold8184_cov258-Pinguiococcus_pyrenoidosus.AAC.1
MATSNGTNGTHAAEAGEVGTFRVKAGLAQMLKGGVIMGACLAAEASFAGGGFSGCRGAGS